jgi:hypothetical protein
VPGGPGHRVRAAERLAEQGRARYLVISQAQYVPQNLCGTHITTALVICFQSSPATTQGEAGATARLAKQYDWHSIVLLTTPDQTLAGGVEVRALLQREHLRGHDTVAASHVAPPDRLSMGGDSQSRARKSQLLTVGSSPCSRM